jgi:hypothetical protein
MLQDSWTHTQATHQSGTAIKLVLTAENSAKEKTKSAVTSFL